MTVRDINEVINRLREWATGPASHNPANADKIQLLVDAADTLEAVAKHLEQMLSLRGSSH